MGDQTVHALRGVSLDIERASSSPSWALGSGKSTLMNILGCLDRPTAGLRLAGEAGADAGRGPAGGDPQPAIGFVFQQFNLLPRTSAPRTSSCR